MEATLQGPLGQTILEPGVVTSGSTPDSRLVVHDPKVSPHHEVVRSTEQGYTITDWGSTGGTFVNEQQLDSLQRDTLSTTLQTGTNQLTCRMLVALLRRNQGER